MAETAMFLRIPSHAIAIRMAAALRDHVAHEEPPPAAAATLEGLAATLDECPRDLTRMTRAEVREAAGNLRERASYLLGVRVGEMEREAVTL